MVNFKVTLKNRKSSDFYTWSSPLGPRTFHKDHHMHSAYVKYYLSSTEDDSDYDPLNSDQKLKKGSKRKPKSKNEQTRTPAYQTLNILQFK